MDILKKAKRSENKKTDASSVRERREPNAPSIQKTVEKRKQTVKFAEEDKPVPADLSSVKNKNLQEKKASQLQPDKYDKPVIGENVIVRDIDYEQEGGLPTKQVVRKLRTECRKKYLIPTWSSVYNKIQTGIIFIKDIVSISDEDVSLYYAENMPLEGMELEGWSRPSSEFWHVFCRASKKTIDDDNVITIEDDVTDNVLSFRLSWINKTDGSPVLFTQEIFNEELASEKSKGDVEQIKKILKEPVSDQTYELALTIITESFRLAKLENNNDIYISDTVKATPYVVKLVTTLRNKSETTEKFLKLLGVIDTILVKIPKAGFESYKKKLEDGMIKPEYLARVSLVDAIPEVFLDERTTEETKDTIRFFIKNESDNFADNFLSNLMSLGTFSRKVSRSSVSGSLKKIKYPRGENDTYETGYIVDNRKSLCRNNASKIPEHRLVFYNEGDTRYCFDIMDLLSNFSSNNFVNPETSNKFSDDFITDILDRYWEGGDEYKLNRETNLPVVAGVVNQENESYEMTPDLFMYLEQFMTSLGVDVSKISKTQEDVLSMSSSSSSDSDDLLSIDENLGFTSSQFFETQDVTDEFSKKVRKFERRDDEFIDSDDGEDAEIYVRCSNCRDNKRCLYKTKYEESDNKFITLCYCSIECFRENFCE